MKFNNKALKISIFISLLFCFLITVFLYLSFNFENKLYDFFLNLFLGLFSSSLVTLIINVSNYFVSKKQLLTKYYEEVKRLKNVFYNISYIDLEFNQYDFIKYIELSDCNKFNDNSIFLRLFNKSTISNNEYKEKLIKNLCDKSEFIRSYIDDKEYNKVLEETFNLKIKFYLEKFDKVLEQYINVSNENVSNLKIMIKDMDFFSGNKLKMQIIENTYKPILNSLKRINYELRNIVFVELFSGNDKAYQISTIFNLQDIIYKVDIEKTDICISTKVYNKIDDQLNIGLCELESIINNSKKEDVEIKPYLVKIKSLKEIY